MSSLKVQYLLLYFSRKRKALWLPKSSNWIKQFWPYLPRYFKIAALEAQALVYAHTHTNQHNVTVVLVCLHLYICVYASVWCICMHACCKIGVCMWINNINEIVNNNKPKMLKNTKNILHLYFSATWSPRIKTSSKQQTSWTNAISKKNTF